VKHDMPLFLLKNNMICHCWGTHHQSWLLVLLFLQMPSKTLITCTTNSDQHRRKNKSNLCQSFS